MLHTYLHTFCIKENCNLPDKHLLVYSIQCLNYVLAITTPAYCANTQTFANNPHPLLPIAYNCTSKFPLSLPTLLTIFPQDSNFSTYQRMWSFMESARPSVFTASNIEGVERVVKGKGSYAFLMESTSIEYVIERNCELTQVGSMLDSKGYGIAMPPSKFARLLCLRRLVYAI